MMNKTISMTLRRAIIPSISYKSLLLTSSSSTRLFAGTTKGAPPISIDDMYGQCFIAEPQVKIPLEREPRAMFDTDMRLNEVVLYLNGGLHACKDQISGDFSRIIFDANVIFFPRDASNKKPEFKQILKSEGGTDELPQLWIHGKLVGSGQELQNFDRVWELCTPARRAWPRDGPYQKGFYNKPGVTRSDQIHIG